ncbi:SDR family NAD(P)-dependent oxidoreductase [Streptomyces sp. NBC_01190]|uniref:SDR family NAD(P)-dependent oxidoreductase n=1 Tax=Streptomyces sp. NBC_01190 TaxID=2903767 RepID=UPI0038698204|nr:SDR family oxidoreductase [Streptomyces sp. NBC_01190]
MDTGLRGRTVLVTGASTGIGAAIARAYSAEGARVALTYRADRDGGQRLARELGAGQDLAMAVRYSLAEPETVESAVAEVTDRWGAVDVLVANAVRWAPRRAPSEHIEDVAAGDWRAFLDDNLAPTLRTVQLAVVGMRERSWGRIVLMSSHVALDGHRGQEFYGAAKSALHGFARSLAWDLGPDGVLVNVVCPGLTTTDRVRDGLPAGIRQREAELTPTGRLSSPEDIAAATLFLGSAANGNTTGQVVTVAGGR